MRLLGPTPPRFPIGISDYAELRREGYTYVDKTELVAEVLDGAKVQLYPRPRRFGKTLNMATLQAFLERGGDDRTDLFADTLAWELDGGRLREHFQRYPVVALSFKDVKTGSWTTTWPLVRRHLQAELERLWKRHGLDAVFAPDSRVAATYHTAMAPDAAEVILMPILSDLVGWLAGRPGERVLVLIDEYDAPLHAAWQHGYWDQALGFFRVLLASGLKDERNLLRGVLTGILKVAKENIFSGLNHVKTHSLLHVQSSTRFGFTEDEVAALATRASLAEHVDGLRDWYDGYRFGGARPSTLYNPWSILQFLAAPEDGFQSFWKNTSSNELIHELLLAQADAVGPDVATLIEGGTVRRLIDDNVPLQELHQSPDALWSLLTFSGYLTPVTAEPTGSGYDATLRIPNREVLAVYQDTFSRVLARGGSGSDAVRHLTRAMLSGDVDELYGRLEALLIAALSYHDFGRSPIEAVYQAFFVGLLVHLEPSHRVVSNREAGFGRADLLVIPRAPGPGAVLELKVVGRRETPEEALARAITQLRDRDYAAEVRAHGATDVYQYAVVFDGKRCWLDVP